jgi:hypothetical protein
MAAPSSLPHSFVLADLFDVGAMSYPVPDYLLEDEPELDWTPCPACDAEGWQENDHAVWLCPRCRGRREVLESVAAAAESQAPVLKRAA